MPHGRREQLMAQSCMDALTPATIVSLEEHCDVSVREIADTDMRWIVRVCPGLVAIAVPVLDAAGKVWGAISVHGPAVRMTATDAVAKLPALHRAAKQMADLL
jgi:DNA-binding IclR family transcriptional regulator